MDGHFSHLAAALLCSAVAVSMVSTSKFKTSGILFLFSSPSPCQMPPRSTTPKTPPPNRAKKEEKKVCRSDDHDRLSPLSPFFSSVYFCPFRNFEKEGGKTRRGSFPSILIIVRDAAGMRNGPVTVSRCANCQLYHSWSSREPPSSRNALANRD